MNSNRLYFIDIIRAFAILMMLQGHFINTLLADSYKDLNIIPYAVWTYFRGITAPTFFYYFGFNFYLFAFKSKRERTRETTNAKRIDKRLFSNWSWLLT